MDNRVVNMRIIIQDVFPASVPQSNSNNNTGYIPSLISSNNTVVDTPPLILIEGTTSFDNDIYIPPSFSTGGTTSFDTKSAKTITSNTEYLPSWKR